MPSLFGYFDQCMIGSDFEKKTQIIADKRTAVKVRAEFGTKVCNGSHEHRSMVGDVNENGTFVSEDAAAYSGEMNKLIAKVFTDTEVPAMSATSPMADWSVWMTSTPLMTVVKEVTQSEFDRAYAPHGGVTRRHRDHLHAQSIGRNGPRHVATYRAVGG